MRVGVTKGVDRLSLGGWPDFNTAGQAKGGIGQHPPSADLPTSCPLRPTSHPNDYVNTVQDPTHPHPRQMALPEPLPHRHSGAAPGSKGKLEQRQGGRKVHTPWRNSDSSTWRGGSLCCGHWKEASREGLGFRIKDSELHCTGHGEPQSR